MRSHVSRFDRVVLSAVFVSAWIATNARAQSTDTTTGTTPPPAPIVTPAASPSGPLAYREDDESAPRKKPFALSFGVGAGLALFTESGPFGTDTGVGLGLAPGYNLNLRASFEFLPWLALDARGLLFHNDGNAFLNYGSITTTGGLAAARFTAPFAHVRPYALLGFGGYHIGASGAQSQLVSGTFSAIEMGLGMAVPTGRNFEVGVEYLYNHLNNETISTNQNADGGDPTTLSFFVQYRLPL